MRAKQWFLSVLSLLGCFGLVAASAQAAGSDLKFCLEEDSPPYSYKFGKKIGGFDYDLSRELAARLGRTFKVQWFETENDEENIPKLEANALLSARLCHLIGGYPLIESALGGAVQGTFRLPDHDGQKRSERHKLFKLGVVTASVPYNRAVFAAIIGPGFSGKVNSLDDFAGSRIMAEVATLPGVLLMRHNKGALIDDTSHISPLKNLLKIMDTGKGDITLIGLHRFERYRFRNPQTKLRFAGYVLPLGFNLGYAALNTSKDLLRDVNKALAGMLADGSLKSFAVKNSMTLMAPQKPDVMGKLRLP
ncbi:MAG: transporter substrate-binding domain-containing protein [Rhodospirillaceae bacterium]|nr:transporter substrate-binding domain-containing protein [Rhodospirillaceae bacterium]